MGLKDDGSQFQRMMEWILRYVPVAITYIHEVLIGSTGNTVEEMVRAHYQDVCTLLTAFGAEKLICHPPFLQPQ